MPIYHPHDPFGNGCRMERLLCPKGDGQFTAVGTVHSRLSRGKFKDLQGAE